MYVFAALPMADINLRVKTINKNFGIKTLNSLYLQSQKRVKIQFFDFKLFAWVVALER